MPVPYLIGTNTAGSGTTLTITTTTASRAGDTLVVGASASATATLVSISDGVNTYIQENSSIAQNPCSVWVAQGATRAVPAGTPVKLTWNSATGTKGAAIIGCSGLLKSVDQNPASTSSAGSTTPSITSGALTAANEVAVAMAVWGFAGGASITWASGWTGLFSPLNTSGGQWTGMAWKTTTATTALTASGTITSARWAMFLLTFADAAVPVVVNQWPLAPGSSYGLEAVGVSNTPGNMLVAFTAWQPGNSQAVSPVSNVADDANNRWVHLGTSPVSGLIRCSIWCAPNTRAGPGLNGGASVVSIATSWYVSGMTGLVVEFAGMPQYAVADFEASSQLNGTSLALSGTAAVPDVVLGVAAGDNPLFSMTAPGTPWNALGQVQFPASPLGLLQPGWLVMAPVWMQAPAGAVSGTWTAGITEDLAGVICGLQAQPPAPVQPNPAFPYLKTEAAFGYEPGDPETVPSWTDISPRAIGPSGNAVIAAKRGRSYELTQPETGELNIMLNNSDGAFTPGNSASPYPGVAVELAARVAAWWGGSYYSVGMGYTERVPQEWPQLPQYGFTPLAATDGIGVLANNALPSALAGDYLLDSPYVYIPCAEEYAAGAAVANEPYGSTNSGAAGQTLANLSRVNTKPAVCLNGVARLGSYPAGTGLAYWFLETGLTLGLTSAVNNSPTGIVGAQLLTGLLGDPGGGIGISTLPATPAGPGWVTLGLFTAPGARYYDPALPQPGSATGITMEFWAILPASVPAAFVQYLLRLDGDPFSYFGTDTPTRVAVFYEAGQACVQVGDYTGDIQTVVAYTVALQDGNPHFWSVTVQDNGGGSYEVQLFIDGQPAVSGTSGGVTTMTDVRMLGIGPVMSDAGAQWVSWNYTIGHVALFPVVLPASRIAAHYTSGLMANTGDTGPQRAARILAWSGFGLARACDLGSPSPVFGPADQIQGQTATAALYTVVSADNGMLYADAAGNVTIRSREALYNRPVKWYFGDAPVPSGVLNANSTFAAGTSPWTALNGATLAQNTAWPADSAASLQITGNGSTANPGAQSELVPVTAGVTYMVSARCYSPQGWSQIQGSINWYNASSTLLSSSAGAVLGLQPQAPMLLPQVTATAPAGATGARIILQALGTPATTVQVLFEPVILACAEVPYVQPTAFDYDNTFLWNLLTAKQQLSSAYDGSSATAIDTVSQQEYFTRGGQGAQIDQTLETTSYQDVLDDVNWGLAKYSQPQIRVKQLVVNAFAQAGNLATWPTVLGVEQGDVCSVIRRPIGGAVITELGIVQKIQHDIGPDRWVTTILVVPYAPSNDVLISDTGGTVGAAAIPW